MPRRSVPLVAVPVLFASITLPAAPAAAQCLDYGHFVHHAGSAALSGTEGRMAADNGLAFVCRGTTGLKIFDIGNPASPTLVTTYDTPGTCTDVAADGNIVYVADGTAGLLVLDVANPASPQVVTTFTPGTISILGREGTRIGTLSASIFRYIDVSNPAAPALLGQLSVSAFYDVKLHGNRAYLGGTGSMKILDLSNPALPALAGTYPVSGGFVSNVEAMGNLVFVCNVATGPETSCNYLVDCSNPAAPTTVWTETTAAAAHDVVVQGSIAYLHSSAGQVRAWDFSTPAAPVLLMRPGLGVLTYLVLSDGMLLSGGSSSIDIVDVAPLQHPPVTTTLSNVPGLPIHMATAPGRLYAIGRQTGDAVLSLIDTSVPGAPVWKSSILASGNAHPGGIAVVGTRVYVHTDRLNAAGLNRLVVIDAATATAPAIIGSVATKGGGGVVVNGNLAYAAQQDGSVAVIDVSVPTAPSFVTEVPIPDIGDGVAVAGQNLYVAMESGLAILDITVPTAPAYLTTYPVESARNVVIRDGLAYVSGYGITVVDVSNPAAPTFVSESPLLGFGSPVRFVGNLGWVAADSDARVIDFSDPATPVILGGQAGLPNNFDDVAIVGDYVYACGSDGSIHVLPGQCATTGVPEAPNVPVAARLRVLPPFPNPTTADVAFVARLPHAGRYDIAIVDVSGRLVTSLPAIEAPGAMDASLAWNGRDQAGAPVPGGVYFVRVRGGGGTATERVLVTR
jgi:hypothetical protein